MVKTNKQWLTAFLIRSSLSKKGLIEDLSVAARQAYLVRDFAQLKAIGEWLIDLSPKTEHLGRLFAVMANRNVYSRNSKIVIGEFESLAESAPVFVRAGAMSTLIADDIYFNKTDSSTINLIREASSLALRSNDLLNFVQIQNQLSLLCSVNGDHAQALSILRNLEPSVSQLTGHFPILKTDFYNSVAYELLQIGKVEAAAYFIQPVLKSPYLHAYSEWLETALEIKQATPQKSNLLLPPSQVFDGYFNPQTFQEYQEKRSAKAKSKVVPIKDQEPESALVIYTGRRRFSQIKFSNTQKVLQKAMHIFLFGSDLISSPIGDKGTMLFEIFYSSGGVYIPIAEHSIRYEYLNIFNDLIREANDLQCSDEVDPDEKPLKRSEILKTIEWLMPKLENTK
jgi:hypothetical protein